MSQKVYIIKKLSPWMMDELLAFSKSTKFDVIFLRKQDSFYDDDLDNLIKNGVTIHMEPYRPNNLIKKISVCIAFSFRNLGRFTFDYNFVIGLKSIIWFLRLDLSKFSNSSNIHSQFATQAAVLSVLIKQYYNREPSISFTFHAHDIYFENKWFNLLVEESAKCFSISEFNIRYVSENYQKSEKIKLARLGMFITDEIKKSNHISKDESTFVFGLLSRFVEKKGIMYLLSAMKRLKEMDSVNIQLVFAGDGPLREEMKLYIEENNLGNQISYIGTVKDKSKVDFFESLDAFILPSITLENDMDGIPVVLMEAIAFGLPVISTDVSGIPEICINEYNGYLIEEKNVDAIVNAMIDMVSNAEKRTVFSKNSLVLSDQYDIQKNSNKKIKMLNWI